MKKILNGFVILILVAGLSSCAKRPESIVASHVSFERYSDKNCIELNTIMSDTREQLNHVSELQNSKATGDAWGVFLVLVPVSQMTGDYEGQVAQLKGEVNAIETAQIKNKCKG